MDRQIKDDCNSSYMDLYNQLVIEYKNDAISHSNRGSISQSRLENIERDAQKAAIRKSLYRMLTLYPNENASDLWRCLYEAHVHRKSGIDDKAVIERVISADQSWKKSSGHAFEEYVKETATAALDETGIRFVLQRDLTTMLNNHTLANADRDYTWLRNQVNHSVFDLYTTIEQDDKVFCFGCVQSKTSVRDRVTRDREPSMQAMDNFFWSIAVVLDGDFLRMPKFIGMVNGGTSEYATNGWHGMYVLSEVESAGRIYQIDTTFEILCNHAKQAAESWLNQRQWFNHEWLPSDETDND